MLCTAVYHRLDTGILHSLGDFINNSLNNFLSFGFSFVDHLRKSLVDFRFKILKAQILKLNLYL